MARIAATHDTREAAQIARARRQYVAGDIDLETFEERVATILRGENGRPLFEGQAVFS
jgi:hypothetical protein